MAKLTVPPLQQNTKKTNKWLILALSVLLLAAIGLGLYFVTQQQVSTRSRAEQEPTAVPAVGGSCPANGASCAWDPVESQDPVTYTYSVKDISTGEDVVSGTTSTTSVTFTPVVGRTYECTVTASTSCGVSGPASASNTCVAEDQPTPTTSPVCGSSCQDDSECPTGNVCTDGKCMLPDCATNPASCEENKCALITVTPTVGPSATPTNTPTPTTGPTATPTQGPSPTPGPSATPTPTGVIVAQSATATPTTAVQPTIPEAGGSSSVYFMVISTILLVTLFLVF